MAVFGDKVAAITGGANGIGRCIAERFLAEGASVAVIDRDRAALEAFAGRHADDRLLTLVGDVGAREDLERFAAMIAERFPGVDHVVNNACFSRGGILSGCGWDEFREVLDTGVLAPYYLVRLLRGSLRPGASIVNISSTRAFQSQPDTESYSAAKGGIAALTHALAASLAGMARVNAICPGWIETDGDARLSGPDRAQHAVGRVGRPDDIAEMVLFLCSERAGFITGQQFTVDGGMSAAMIYHDDHGWRYNPEEK